MKAIEAVKDLIEEVKIRTIYWAFLIFGASYFFTHTSNSLWMNVPISILLVSALRIFCNKVDLRWRIQRIRSPTYLSHLERKQLSINEARLSTVLQPGKWKRKIGSPIVEAAMNELINKLLQDFVVDLWYSDITTDTEASELMRALIMDVLGEISGRVKELNLVDLLTRDVVDLIGDHLDLYRRNQLAIGRDVMSMLTTEERDERLKHHLMDSRQLHPALVSSDLEYKVLRRLVSGLLGVVLRAQEANCSLARCIARELVTSLVLQPIMSFACPMYINELIEYLFISIKDDEIKVSSDTHSVNMTNQCSAPTGGVDNSDPILEKCLASCKEISEPFDALGISSPYEFNKNPMQSQSADWGRMLAAVTKRRTEVLTPDNLENMWSKGRHYKHKIPKPVSNVHGFASNNLQEETPSLKPKNSVYAEDDIVGRLTKSSKDLNRDIPFEDMTNIGISGNKGGIKRSNSTSALKLPISIEPEHSGGGEGSIISDFYSPYSFVHGDSVMVKGTREVVLHVESLGAHKLNCRVIGAYFEKIGSKSFAVYSIEVTDSENKTWFVKRRYRNFERLHRHLKEIPNYTLHLPPKRIFSSSTEDAFVHQRCIQLHKYLQELLSIANVAEQHEVWDFLSSSSKNYAFGKSSSVIKTLAVSVDDAVDDIFRQLRKVVGPTQSEPISIHGRSSPCTTTDMCNYSNKQLPRHNTMDITNSLSENEVESDTVCSQDVTTNSKPTDLDNGWHSDNEISSKSLPPRVIKLGTDRNRSHGHKHHQTCLQTEEDASSRYPTAHSKPPYKFECPVGMPPEWTPTNVSVPLLNLVDKIFQLKRRGWIRRQAFWISKQIIQLVMEDAIDDFLLRQINFVRREDVIADCIRSIRNLLWPDGSTFFMKVEGRETTVSELGSFEARFEASRRANDVKKMIFEGAPAALVSLLGQKQYKRCAEDMYYFLQSTVCVKQLAYGILELLLVSAFPELREVVIDVHGMLVPPSMAT